MPTQIQVQQLYELLKERTNFISHKSLPSFEEHQSFVDNHPYIGWFIINKNEVVLGSVYIQSDNSVGLNFKDKFDVADVSVVLDFINSKFSPLPPIHSVRRGEFFINVAFSNHKLINALKIIGKSELQISYLI